MNVFKLGDKALDNTHELSFNFLAEDNNSQTSVSYVINTNASPVSEHKVNFIIKPFFFYIMF